MNKNDKLKMFWKIISRINKNFCNNKVKVNEIILFSKGDLDKSFPDRKGWYFSDKRFILIGSKENLKMQIEILVHEFTHAYQHQILDYSGERRGKHLKTDGEVYQRFLKSTEDILTISLKH